MSDLIVIDHHHDEDAGVYRIVVGVPVEHVMPMTDEDGNELFGPDRPVIGEDGEPLMRRVPIEGLADGEEPPEPEWEPVTERGEPMLETIIHHHPLEDFVFAADDERWEGKSPEEVAKAQREIIAEALQAREREAQTAARRAADARTALPGVGDPL